MSHRAAYVEPMMTVEPVEQSAIAAPVVAPVVAPRARDSRVQQTEKRPRLRG